MKFDSSSNDLDLIEGCLAGEEAAWAAMVTKYERLIYATCRRYNLQQAEADDIFGRVCLLLLQNLENLKDRTRLTSWLITTTSRECWHYRKNSRPTAQAERRGETEPGQLEEFVDEGLLPEEELLRLERLQQVRECLKLLSPRCQKLIWLLFYDPAELPYTQIASQLNLPVASIGPNRARCLDKLRAQLQKVID